MEFKDLLISPFYLLVFYLLAYLTRDYFTDPKTRRYFIPAITLKFIGAISLGLIYQFYYNGGDTFNYFTHGSKWIWEAFLNNPIDGIKLIFSSGGKHFPETFEYTQHIWYFKDERSYFIVRITAFIDLLTFHTYSATTLFFAAWSFGGSWALFTSFYRLYPKQMKWIALATLFVPSVVFWGSGILKDTVTFGALGFATFGLINIIHFKKYRLLNTILVLSSFWLIYSIKAYILITYVIALSVWLYSINIYRVKSFAIRILIAPVILLFFSFGGYLTLNRIMQDNSRYSFENIAQTAAVTAYDIRYGWGARDGSGAGYTLGELDGSVLSMVKLAPAAINVSLFRPYLWEVKNPLMLLSALEAITLFLITMVLMYRGRRNLTYLFSDPQLRFCLVFSVLFAFAVGVSTYNFGTLMRYKIPLMPFYMIFLIILNHGKRDHQKVS